MATHKHTTKVKQYTAMMMFDCRKRRIPDKISNKIDKHGLHAVMNNFDIILWKQVTYKTT